MKRLKNIFFKKIYFDYILENYIEKDNIIFLLTMWAEYNISSVQRTTIIANFTASN